MDQGENGQARYQASPQMGRGTARKSSDPSREADMAGALTEYLNGLQGAQATRSTVNRARKQE